MLDQRDARPLERDIAEFHPAAEEGAELEIDPAGLEGQERSGAELRIFGYLELVELDGRKREKSDRQRLELHRPADRLRRADGDHRLDPGRIDEAEERR